MTRPAQNLRRLAVAIGVIVALILGLNAAFPPPIERAAVVSAMVADRDGRPLRAFPTAEGRWRFAAQLDTIDPLFIDALLAVEDKRFFVHGGVDWFAMVRAIGTSLRAGRIVSGGSTITMQTARLLEPRRRTFAAKLIEMVRAIQLEARLSKREILELYLTLAPYGGNLEGVRAASFAWFGHGPDALSDDEIALLIALPQSPERRRPDRFPEQAQAARAGIAAKLEQQQFLGPARRMEVNVAPLPTRQSFPAKAWHGAAQVLEAGPRRTDTVSTLDAGLQSDLERLLAQKAADFGDDVQLAAMVVDIPTRAVRAAIGSAGRGRPGGWLDLTRQARSPGSTLKPFIYAMAFDDGAALPTTVIADLPKRFAAYQPENFDRGFRGDVTIAEALQHSLNVPAVIALDRVGPSRFAAQLRLAGASPRIHGSGTGDPGLALALGGAGLTLQELAVLYAALGDGGIAKPLVWRRDAEAASAKGEGTRFLNPSSAASVLDILKQAPPPEGYLPGRLSDEAPQLAFKTGTSYGFRDAWAAGVAGDLAIVVWVGRADGAPRPGHVGRSDALPVLFEIADRAVLRLDMNETNVSRLTSPEHRPAQAALARFAPDAHPPDILFPPRGAELWAGSVGERPPRPFVLAASGEGPLSWYIDGVPCPLDDAGLPIWLPAEPGFYKISVVDGDGRAAHVQVRVMTS
ncbi:MAG: penicillin-binding protein 1C [Pseudomonadota bacterium]